MPRKKYYQLLETTIDLLNKHTDIKTCRICLDKMTDNIVVGSLCGHCFHENCIQLMGKINVRIVVKIRIFIKYIFNIYTRFEILIRVSLTNLLILHTRICFLN